MGKKSNRHGGKTNKKKGSKEAHTNAKFERIDRDIQVWTKEASDMHDNFLHFQARDKYYEILSLMAAEKELLQRNYPIKSDMHYYNVKNIIIRTDIATVEVTHRNFESVVPLFQFCKKNFPAEMKHFFKLELYYYLTLMVTGKLESSEATAIASKLMFSKPTASRQDINTIAACIWLQYIGEFRRLKKWDDCLDFTGRISDYLDQSSSYCSSLEYVATYIERYRVEAAKRSKHYLIKMSVSLYNYIFTMLGKGIRHLTRGLACRHSCQHSYHILVLAQWLFLNQHGTFEECNKIRDIAVRFVAKYIESIHSEFAMNSCLGCREKSTDLKPGFVCGGCRAVCFCSRDHQRSSWRRLLDWGVGIGHKMLCPLHKAYRKYRNAEKGHGGEKNVDEYRLRFLGECETFLSKSLGLEDLCFNEEFVNCYARKYKGIFLGTQVLLEVQ